MRRKGELIEFPYIDDAAEALEREGLRWIERPGNALRAVAVYVLIVMMLVIWLGSRTARVFEAPDHIPVPVFIPREARQ